MLGLLSLFITLPTVQALPASSPKMLRPYFVLAGDSTTATQSSNGGGWGDGFLNTTLFKGASGHNYGHNGATTVSFRAGGNWDKVLSTVKNVSHKYHPFVTIQFGHNDQKAAANISLSQYTENLQRFVVEAVDAGATPILVTPLSRRNYDISSGEPLIIQDLANQTAATVTAAHNTGASFIDLNRASTQYLNAIGPTDAYTYNLITTDHTHLNVEGSIVFGGIVAELIQWDFPALHAHGFLRVNETLKEDVDRGIYCWP
jgi:lysophospholipase L1-like esterase